MFTMQAGVFHGGASGPSHEHDPRPAGEEGDEERPKIQDEAQGRPSEEEIEHGGSARCDAGPSG